MGQLSVEGESYDLLLGGGQALQVGAEPVRVLAGDDPIVDLAAGGTRIPARR